MPKWLPSSRKPSISGPTPEPESPGLAGAVIPLVRAYQLVLGPVLPRACRFEPTCSRFALEALRRYGAVRGSVLTARRLSRCHPWNPGGYDPVPVRRP
ncbi:MAG TPA: membrane protein insertion efficiency factor YidD [Actinomycetota bacterium]|jgi:uncharacterized protein|nr:membrane protein insertion efficiency factor YidD [Actinomycetota bacterium]